MTTQTDLQVDDLADLLPDDLRYPVKTSHKKGARPLVRTPARVEKDLKAADEAVEKEKVQTQAQRLAQIVNLHIAGYSLADIGEAIGATESEVDRLLTQDAARYVRSQPALRTYVRNFISSKYTSLLEAVWDEATDKTHIHKLENQDRALRILDRMAKLHGADAPTQTEVTVEAAPEAVEKLVNALAATHGLGYDVDVFDVVDGEVVHDAVGESAGFLETASHAVENAQEGDEDGF